MKTQYERVKNKENEIGSEFWNIPTVATANALFPKETRWFQSGRSALLAILEENDFHTAAVPFWCCDSMIIPFLERRIKVIFYKDTLPNTDCALVLDYFGYTNRIVSTDNFKGIVIRDLTHSLFSKKYCDADYYFGSLRKWAGFITGGFAWGFHKKTVYETSVTSYPALREKAMNMKKKYIDGKIVSKQYLDVFAKAEELLDDYKIYPALIDDTKIVKFLDVNTIIEKRRKNAKILMDNLTDCTIFHILNENDCPMFVPIRLTQRDKLRKYLIDNRIYCPVHWPLSKYHEVDEEERKLYDEELSLVCDQRYDADDMYRIVKAINTFLGS